MRIVAFALGVSVWALALLGAVHLVRGCPQCPPPGTCTLVVR